MYFLARSTNLVTVSPSNAGRFWFLFSTMGRSAHSPSSRREETVNEAHSSLRILGDRVCSCGGGCLGASPRRNASIRKLRRRAGRNRPRQPEFSYRHSGAPQAWTRTDLYLRFELRQLRMVSCNFWQHNELAAGLQLGLAGTDGDSYWLH